MTDLKTLKQIEKKDWSINEGDLGLVRAVFFDIKAEAIKEVKLDFPTEQMPDELRGLTQDQKNAIKDYIKWKNNISEEELK